MNLYTPEEMTACEQDINDLVDTFGSQITIYKTSEQLLISQDPNFIFTLGDEQSATSLNYVSQSGVFTARVKYLDFVELQRTFATKNKQLNSETQLRLDLSNPTVRLKLGQEAYDFIGDFQRAQFDNQTWVILKSVRPHGLFKNRNYYTIYLQQTN